MGYNTLKKYLEGKQTLKDVYNFIDSYIAEHAYPPSMPEIADGLNISPHTANNCFLRLKEIGMIETEHPGVARAYRLTGTEIKKVKRYEIV